jgi:hypothetical protein
MRLGPNPGPKGSLLEPVEYEIELERSNAPADHKHDPAVIDQRSALESAGRRRVGVRGGHRSD